jgi:molybdopterin/thiamine biosynthesis adenylyltransferase
VTQVPFRYGASFVDKATGLRFEMHHPASRPDRWRAYVEGATHAFARHGIAGAGNLRELTPPDDVTLFYVGVDPDDRVVAGGRCRGPLDDAEAAQVLDDMSASSEIDALRDAAGTKGAYGVVELKGAWRSDALGMDHRIFPVLVRLAVLSAEWMGAELMLLSSADRWATALEQHGLVPMGTEPTPYPDDRYRTMLYSLHRPRYGRTVAPQQAQELREAAEQLHRSPDPADVGWRPVILDVARRGDRQILANLRADPGMETLDLVERQQAELEQLLPSPDRELLDEPTRHVYYPWRRTVVHTLGPRAFRAVRLDRNRNRITRTEQERLHRQRIGVVGLSAGHWAAATIVLEGLCGELRLADFDHIELTNLNRLPATVLDLGMNKTIVAARRMAEIDPYLPVHIAPTGLSPDNVEEFVAGLDVIVEECDDISMKLMVREVARRHRVPVVMETSDRGLLDVERFDQEPDRPVFHGLLDGVTSADMGSMTTSEKVPHVLRIVDGSQTSARTAASMAEVGRTLSTWPQLGSDVTLGGATVATTVRRLGLGEPVPSGRVRIDLEAAIVSLESPERPVVPPGADAVPSLPPTPEDPLLAIAHAAVLAPSGGNVQPWRLELSPDALRLELDRSKTTGMDVRYRGSYVALGAAVFNARVAAAAAGRLGDVTYFPDGPTSDVVAKLALGSGSDPELAAMYTAMLARCANRRLGEPVPLDLALAARLGTAVTSEGGTLHLVTDPGRIAECAQVLGACERIRFLTPRLHQEMMSELRWPGEDSTVGIDVRTLELSDSDLAKMSVIRRTDVVALLERWDVGDALGDNARTAVRASSALAVVTVPNASPAAYLRGGSAVERLWIVAQQAGMGVQPVSPVFVFAVQEADFETLGGSRWAAELHALSTQFRATVGLGSETALALVLRLSHVPPPSVRSTRLPLDAVLRRSGPQEPVLRS